MNCNEHVLLPPEKTIRKKIYISVQAKQILWFHLFVGLLFFQTGLQKLISVSDFSIRVFMCTCVWPWND